MNTKLVEAKAILLPNGGNKNDYDEDIEEFEFDILYDEKKELWLANL